MELLSAATGAKERERHLIRTIDAKEAWLPSSSRLCRLGGVYSGSREAERMATGDAGGEVHLCHPNG